MRRALFAPILISLALLFSCRPAFAQEAPDSNRRIEQLESENARLRERVRELEQQLAIAYRRIAELERAVDQAEPTTEEVQPEAEPIAFPADQPLASPDSLLNAVQADFHRQFGEDLEVAEERDRLDYMRKLRSWTSQMERRLRGRVQWRGLVNDRRIADGRTVLTIVVVDPETAQPWSRPFDVVVPDQVERKLQYLDLARPIDLIGVMMLDLNFNEQRAEPGPFNEPPLIGPFVEFGYEIDVQAITAAPEPEQSR